MSKGEKGFLAAVIVLVLILATAGGLVLGGVIDLGGSDDSTTAQNSSEIEGATPPATAAEPSPDASTPAGQSTADPAGGVDPAWVKSTAQKTGIPDRALQAYAAATAKTAKEQPRCGLAWNTLAAIGQVESNHGREGGATIKPDGNTDKPIVGVALDGVQSKNIPDTDKGELDGDKEHDRAVGPMQFIPQTWRQFARDGNGDGKKDPNNIDDAALTAASYLCSAGDIRSPQGWNRAVRGYNDSDVYVRNVLGAANQIAGAAGK